MRVGIISVSFKQAPYTELNLKNMHPDAASIFHYYSLHHLWCLICLHATQTPIISRTTNKERMLVSFFYGMMIAEGIIAMIWAAAGMSLFNGYNGLMMSSAW